MTSDGGKQPRPDRRVPGFVFVLILAAVLGTVAWVILANATGSP